MPSLTVVVPATDRPPTLDTCLRAIREAADSPEQVVVVDDPAAGGPAAARNAGARGASGEVLVFVDSDVEVHADAFTRIREAFQADPELTAVFGSYDDEPAADGITSTFRNLLHHHVHQQAAGPAETFWAGLGAVRRDEFLASGGFDPVRYPAPSIEDIDLGIRLVQRSATIRLDPTLQGKHLKRWSLAEMVRTDVFARGVPWTLALLRRRRFSAALNLGLRHRLSAACAVVLAGAAVARRPRPGIAALAGLVALNGAFYRLLWKRGGPAGAIAGVGLHVVHHLSAAIAVPLALAAFAREHRRERAARAATVQRG